ncbi:DUF3283 family protein [Thaumasiovibrio subtropicus]|uniref:DUF3283 family protein n=1 Tax=Thaumasiovibrio subtropicus TaxID=1891207 RepID=UPI000B34FF25|nr:DUF3283 family protein [Thaumasiovibrio subtropicus]
MMNLCTLSVDEKYRIELDKQAAYVVWKMKQGKAGNEAIHAELEKMKNDDEKSFFRQSIEMYQIKMTTA